MIRVPADPTAQGLEIVIPLRDMREHVAACILPLLEQTKPGDVVTVVDDGSTDDTAAIAAELGARVLPVTASQGPYSGRHMAAERSAAEALLFVDGRSRPLPGLLDSHRRQLAEPGCAMSCTDVAVVSDRTLAGRIAVQQDIFSLDKYIGVPGRLDYFPTCNLGVIRSAYLAVGGFRQMRSGGDADLCWRIQNAGLGWLSYDTATLMEWVPRNSVRDLARQWYRYGQSSAILASMYPRQNAPRPAGERPRRGRLRRLAGQAQADFPAALMLVTLELLMRTGAARTRRHPLTHADYALLGEPATASSDPPL